MPFTPRILYPALQAPVLPPSLTPEAPKEDKWHQPWSEPVRFKPQLTAADQEAFFWCPRPPIVSFGWMAPFGEPVRIKPALHVSHQQAAIPDPQPFVPFSWFEWLSEPVRIKPALPAALQLAPFPQPTPIINISWFNWLSEPVRSPPALLPAIQLAPFPQPTPIISIGWFEALAEPVRYKIDPRLQITLSIAATAIWPTVSFTPGSGVPLFYQVPTGSLATSQFWKGRGVQK